MTSDQYPEQIHISYGSSQDSMVVMWSSRDQLDWEVHYGTIPTIMKMSTNSTMAKLPDADFNAAKYVYRSELHVSPNASIILNHFNVYMVLRIKKYLLFYF